MEDVSIGASDGVMITSLLQQMEEMELYICEQLEHANSNNNTSPAIGNSSNTSTNNNTYNNTTSAFDTVITGLGWLVRNSKSYIRDNLFNTHTSTSTNKSEDITHYQGTGDSNTFSNVLSARTAIGYDIHGTLLILQVEGQTWVNGMYICVFVNVQLAHIYNNCRDEFI